MAADVLTPPPARRRGRAPRPWTPFEFATLAALPVFAGRALRLDDGVVVEVQQGGPRSVRFTRAEFAALDAARFFRGQRVRLVRGVLVLEPPMNPPHATGVYKTARTLERAFPTGHVVRSQLPLDLDPLSRPHPDVAVAAGSVEDFAAAHPTTAVLVAEVADDSLFEDTTEQAELYASAGVPEYWVVDVVNRALVVFRDPRPIPDGGTAYRTRADHGDAETVAPLAAAGAAVRVADLLP